MSQITDEQKQQEEEFFKKAKEKFGDKIRVSLLCDNQELFDQFLSQYDPIEGVGKPTFTFEDVEKYGKQAWLTNNNHCPNCESPSGGFFGTFEWGFVHGVGHCSECGVMFRNHHYFGDDRTPLILLSVEGF